MLDVPLFRNTMIMRPVQSRHIDVGMAAIDIFFLLFWAVRDTTLPS